MVSPTRTSRLWWEVVTAGVVAILFGIVAIGWPALTVAILVLLFGAYVIIEGIVHLVAMFRAMGTHTTWWPQLLIGIIDIAAGLFVIANPGLTSVVFVYLVSFWAISLGLVAVVAGLFQAQLGSVIVGVLAIVLGFILLQDPVRGILAYVLVIGIFAIVRGVLLLVEAIRAPSVVA